MRRLLFLFLSFFVFLISYSQSIDKSLFVKGYVLVGISSDEKKLYSMIDKIFTKRKAEELKKEIDKSITKEIKMSISELKKRLKLVSNFFYVGINIEQENRFFIAIPTDNPKESVNTIIGFIKKNPKTRVNVETVDNIGVVKKNNSVEMTYLIDDNKLILSPKSDILKEYMENKKEPDGLITEVTENTSLFVYLDEMEKNLNIQKPVMVTFEVGSDIRIIGRSTERENIKPIPIKFASPIFYIILPLNQSIKNAIFSEIDDPNMAGIKEIIGDQIFLSVSNFDYQSIVNNVYNSIDFVFGVKINDVGKTTEFLMKNSQGMLQQANKPYPAFTLLLPGISFNISIQNDHLLISTKEISLSSFTPKNFLFIDLQRLINKIPPLKSKIIEFGINPNLRSIEGYIEDKKDYQENVIVIK